MRIAYIADHRGRGNDDEGAITHALQSLGHEVIRIQENTPYHSYIDECSFVLFHHHWNSPERLSSIKVPKVFWFFDLIHHLDIPNRHTNHLERITRMADIGFCTDGYWAERNANVFHLMQGVDELNLPQQVLKSPQGYPILFAGSTQHQPGRKSQCRRLSKVYGKQFIARTGKEEWVYKEDFAKVVAKSKIVLSLKSPTKPNYWSNRVYNVAGYRGFQLHPFCEMLADHYQDGEEIIYYHSQEDLENKIDCYLPREAERKRIGANALSRTLQEHTYTHRCRQLLDKVKEKLF